MSIEVNPEQPIKAEVSIELMELGKLMEVMPVQP